MIVKKTVVGMLLLGVAATANAAGVEEIIGRLGGAASVYKKFDTDVGLKGYVLSYKGKGYGVVFSNPEETYLMSGMLMGADGENLAKKYYDLYVPKPDYLGELKSSNSIWMGNKNAPRVMHVLAEVNCGHCRRLYSNLAPYIEKGELAVSWTMVGFTKDGLDKAAYAMGAKDPAEALGAMLKGDAGEEPKASMVLKVDQNKEIFSRLGVQGTPFIAFKSLNGNVQTVPGAVEGENLAALIKVATR